MILLLTNGPKWQDGLPLLLGVDPNPTSAGSVPMPMKLELRYLFGFVLKAKQPNCIHISICSLWSCRDWTCLWLLSTEMGLPKFCSWLFLLMQPCWKAFSEPCNHFSSQQEESSRSPAKAHEAISNWPAILLSAVAILIHFLGVWFWLLVGVYECLAGLWGTLFAMISKIPCLPKLTTQKAKQSWAKMLWVSLCGVYLGQAMLAPEMVRYPRQPTNTRCWFHPWGQPCIGDTTSLFQTQWTTMSATSVSSCLSMGTVR